MTTCRHCKGTGVEPDVITLECIGCQKRVRIQFTSSADLVQKSLNVLCSECEPKKESK